MVTDVDIDGITVKYADGHEERIGAVCKIWAAGVSASPLAAMVGKQSGAEVDRSGRVAVLPDLTLPGPSRGVRRRRHDDARQAARRRPGGDPGWSVRRAADHGPAQRQAHRQAVSLPRQGQPRDRVALQRGGRHRPVPVLRFLRLADLAGRAPLLHHRFQEAADHVAALDGQLPRPVAIRAGRHRAAGHGARGARAARRELERVPAESPTSDVQPTKRRPGDSRATTTGAKPE